MSYSLAFSSVSFSSCLARRSTSFTLEYYFSYGLEIIVTTLASSAWWIAREFIKFLRAMPDLKDVLLLRDLISGESPLVVFELSQSSGGSNNDS